MTLEEGLNILHIDAGYNDSLVSSLIEAIPSYIETTTGMKPEQQGQEPLCKTVGGFLLQLWYYADKADDMSLNRTIEALLKAISLKVER